MQGIGRRDDLRIPYPGPEALIGRGFNHASTAQNVGGKTAMTIHYFSARLGTGEERRLTNYRGKVLLIVRPSGTWVRRGDRYLLRRYLWGNFPTVRQDRGQRQERPPPLRLA
jgi:hypothetical protein